VAPPAAAVAASDAHHYERYSDNIQHVHAKQVRPRRQWLAEQKFLQAEKQTKKKDFPAAQNRRPSDFIGRHSLLAKFVRNQRKRTAR